MAADLMDAHPVFRQWMEIGDRIVNNLQGFSPLAHIYAPDRTLSEPFDRLEHSHPSLFMTQFALAKLLQNKGVRPDMLLGVSLGEFVAMSVAGMIPFETALKAVARQPEIFRQSAAGGALIAALAPGSIRDQSPILAGKTEIAGTMGSQHCVLACQEADIAGVIQELKRLDVMFQALPVRFAFHSRWIETAREAYFSAVSDLRFEAPFWPVWSACLGRPLEQVNADLIWNIVRQPMQLSSTIAAIEARGGARYVDLSPTGSLAAIMRYDLKQTPSSIVSLLSPFGGNLKRLDALFSASA
jgi:acyl transferase domain-containing protein